MTTINPLYRAFDVETDQDVDEVPEQVFSSGVRYLSTDNTIAEGFVDGNDVAWIRRDEIGFATPLKGNLEVPFTALYYFVPKIEDEDQLDITGGILREESDVRAFALHALDGPALASDGEGNKWHLRGFPEHGRVVLATRVDFDETGTPVARSVALEDLPLPVTIIEVS